MRSRNILVTAATGSTGNAALLNLLKLGISARAMAHREDEHSAALFEGLNHEVEKITGQPPLSIERFVTKNRAAFA